MEPKLKEDLVAIIGKMYDNYTLENEIISEAIKMYNSGYYKFKNIGVDPEFFIVDKKGKLVPASTIFPSAKNKGSNPAAFYDNLAVELNVTPSLCRQTLTKYISDGLQIIHDKIQEVDPSYRIIATPTISVSEEILASVNPEIVQWGCEPTNNAYNITAPAPDALVHKKRYAGGHLHCQLTNDRDEEHLAAIVRGLDLILGIFCVLLEDNRLDKERRKYYGLPGEWRLQSYGFEYRTLSNFYYNSPALTNLILGIFKNSCYILSAMTSEKINELISSITTNKEIFLTIAKSDKKKAYDIFIKTIDMFMSWGHRNPYTMVASHEKDAEYMLRKMFALIELTPAKFFTGYGDMPKAWNLEKYIATRAVAGWESKAWEKMFTKQVLTEINAK